MPKENLIFKLDNLEYQYNYLKGTLDSFQPRLSSTSKAYNAKGKKTSKKMTKLLGELRLEVVESELNDLQLEIFQKKVYHLDMKLRHYLEKQLSQYKFSKRSKKDFTPVIDDLSQEYGLNNFAALVSKSKAVKLSLSRMRVLQPLPQWFTEHEFCRIHNDKNHKYNPSRVWNEVILKSDGRNQLLSLFMNSDKYKDLIAGFSSSMNTFLGIRKDKKKIEKENSKEDARKQVVTESGRREKIDQREEADQSSESDQKDEEEFDENLLKEYDNMLVGSEDDEGHYELDPSGGYNEKTDEELSDNEAEHEHEEEDINNSEHPPKKKLKYELPELMGGYYSGEDSAIVEDLANDKVAKEQISLKGERKNRRGQRARRKIWEQKFGTKANHIMKERKLFAEKREKKQKEYEERVAKRSAKAAAMAAVVPPKAVEQQLRSSSKLKKAEPSSADHPSWIAKREAEAKLKNAKFEGKRVIFD
ncbi:BUD22 (YMR014W) [Zygosaccharomyces parabailii]|nr:BUD22 (YMR014W) [Zygosaccharomyces parabailii]CDH11697.1 uncharacterized protein ZBAI_03483 [Zygosaccharomyces bailii ISA1307]